MMSNKREIQKRHREHYEIEKSLSLQLRNAKKQERHQLYASVYEELFNKLKNHPQLKRKVSPDVVKKRVDNQLKFLTRFINKDTTFMEVGSGDCSLSAGLSTYVKSVFAFDVSETISSREKLPENVKLVIFDGCSFPEMGVRFDVAYSNQLMEHLHPDDVLEQLKSIYDNLSQQGCYVCITPNSLTGPHDVSKYYDSIATGLHLKEYTNVEVEKIFSSIGFSKINFYTGERLSYTRMPFFILKWIEIILETMPLAMRKVIAKSLFRPFLGVRVVAYK